MTLDEAITLTDKRKAELVRELTLKSMAKAPFDELADLKEQVSNMKQLADWLQELEMLRKMSKETFLCDKKPGACKSWDRHGWTKCESEVCHRTTDPAHAVKDLICPNCGTKLEV